ncbi:MAG: hypothetical protein R3E79_46670 [Caldilineaceae bacterium]
MANKVGMALQQTAHCRWPSPQPCGAVMAARDQQRSIRRKAERHHLIGMPCQMMEERRRGDLPETNRATQSA